ncbi:Hypothetical protein I596_784 [Dokdonella koreensis DS-123]|uniref:Uncharacterized protein n=1 Tax=Dokdonella koreensis DS-123 TaxID=1300342 RepID=A0A160DSG0_9GAMM|nr:Hypothetical protein I596_784 [Dokdonella koreensis DS-123]
MPLDQRSANARNPQAARRARAVGDALRSDRESQTPAYSLREGSPPTPVPSTTSSTCRPFLALRPTAHRSSRAAIAYPKSARSPRASGVRERMTSKLHAGSDRDARLTWKSGERDGVRRCGEVLTASDNQRQVDRVRS